MLRPLSVESSRCEVVDAGVPHKTPVGIVLHAAEGDIGRSRHVGHI